MEIKKRKKYSEKRRKKILELFGNKCFLCNKEIKPNQRYVIHHLNWYLYQKEKEIFGKKIAPSSNIKWIEENIDNFILLHHSCHEFLHNCLNILFKYHRCSLKELFKNIEKIIKISEFSQNWEILKPKVLDINL